MHKINDLFYLQKIEGIKCVNIHCYLTINGDSNYLLDITKAYNYIQKKVEFIYLDRYVREIDA